MTDDEKQEIYEDFKKGVNMAPAELEKWLKTEESREVGYKESDGDESVGHDSGTKIVKIKRTKKADLTEADYKHMRKVNGYIARHTAQRPKGDVEDSRWRYSLMNWGHDPLKED